jgi:glutamate dehydrogenase/leucine dehydrogenase
MTQVLLQSPARFAAQLRERGRRRVLLATAPSGELRVHPEGLVELAELLREPSSGYQAHEAVFLEVGRRSGALLSAFVHTTCRGQAQGGLRCWSYDTLAELLRDGLRLSRAMGRKNALAGLWWGGGKGILADEPDLGPTERRLRYREYGDFVSSLRGCYVTAEDVGTSPEDLAEVFRRTRFATCIPEELGGSGNPSDYTARGVVCAMEAALEFRGMGSLRGRRIAMQGGGSVGAAMIDELLERDVASIAVAEISARRCEALARRFFGRAVEVRQVKADDASILAEACDVLAPNGLGAVLGPETIPRVRAAIVCGAANNPLIDEERDAHLLAKRGITYVPDFIANRLGIVHCANEQYGYVARDESIERHLERGWEGSIFAVVQRVLARAQDEGVSPLEAANCLADELALQPHPIWGQRARSIIDSLIEERWYEG